MVTYFDFVKNQGHKPKEVLFDFRQNMLFQC